jgi:hypothetical protein
LSTTLTALPAILISLAAITWLGRTDPKRLRNLRAAIREADARSRLRSLRRAASLSAVMPGVVLALFGAWPALLIWLGTTISGGWLVAQLLSTNFKKS